MAASVPNPDDRRSEAARIAFTLLRFEEVAAHPPRGSTPPASLRVGPDAYVFLPSWRIIPRDAVETFLVGLPSPALLLPTTTRGIVTLMLVHELSGDRRRWAERTLRNFTAGLEELARRLGLSPTSRILCEFDDESHIFSFAGVREWTQQFAVHVGWSISPLVDNDHADGCLMLSRSDGKRFQGRSCAVPPGWLAHAPESGAT